MELPVFGATGVDCEYASLGQRSCHHFAVHDAILKDHR